MTSLLASIRRGGVQSLVPEKYRMVLGAFVFFVVMIGAFTIANPRVFTSFGIFGAVFVSLPIFIVIAVAGVWLVTAGEIDLSFPSTITLSALAFASAVDAGIEPWIAVLFTLLVGLACGAVNSILVVGLGLSSLVSTLGSNFVFLGLTRIIQSGDSIDTRALTGTLFRDIFVGKTGVIPNQMFWGLGFALVAWLFYNRHKIGVAVRIAGDNPQAGREMGLNIKGAKSFGFLAMGLAAALAAIITVLVNQSFSPTMGQGYLLPALAAIFVGGTPIWGGIGTIGGAVIGAFTVAFIETGIIAAGLTGFFTQFVFGIVIILSLIGHRLVQGRSSRDG
jgi:ribose/xylose/arabinose/galactoside ABC-type transport system permease subunit